MESHAHHLESVFGQDGAVAQIETKGLSVSSGCGGDGSALLQDLNSCSLAALPNPGKRDWMLGVADLKSCSGWPVPLSTLYPAAPKAGQAGLDTGFA